MSFIYKNSLSVNSKGGTELMATRLEERLPKGLLDNFQIFVSRVEQPLDQTKIRIFYAHDLPGDPSSDILANGGYKNFHRIVFTSNWQMQAYINHYKIPFSHCKVLLNAIIPIEDRIERNDGKIKLAYWSTPHRGLALLVPVFEKLSEEFDNIELDVYSSFKLYGWDDRDKQFEELFRQCIDHPKINYLGTVENNIIRENLRFTDILAYPSIWTETSCITLMEAMSAGMTCVHSNLGALYETAANWTIMYQVQEDVNAHANLFYSYLKHAILMYNDPNQQNKNMAQKKYADAFYSIDIRAMEWEQFLTSLLDLPRGSEPEMFFTYRTP